MTKILSRVSPLPLPRGKRGREQKRPKNEVVNVNESSDIILKISAAGLENYFSKFGLTRSRKCIYYEYGAKVEGTNLFLVIFLGANVLEPVANCTFATVHFEPLSQVSGAITNETTRKLTKGVVHLPF